jgi:hypothetical protein
MNPGSKRALRRHQAISHMNRRLKEDQAQHRPYINGDKGTGREETICGCLQEGKNKEKARFKEQPKRCSGMCCGNVRKYEGPTLQEKRHELRYELSEQER